MVRHGDGQKVIQLVSFVADWLWGYRHVVEFKYVSLYLEPTLTRSSKGEALDSNHRTMNSRGPISVTTLGSASNHG